MTKKLWRTGFELDSLKNVLKAQEASPAKLDVVNRSEFYFALKELVNGQLVGSMNGPRVELESLPPLKLVCLAPVPAPDFFGYAGLVFVSKKFRQAIKYWNGCVQYHPVELVASSDSAKEADYRVIRVVCADEIVDINASTVGLMQRPNGGLPLITERSRLVIKDGKYSGIFFDPRIPEILLASDAAARLERAQLSGLSIYAFAGAKDPGGVQNPFPTDEAEVAALLAET